MEGNGIRRSHTRGICVPSSGKENTSSTRTVKQGVRKRTPCLRFLSSSLCLRWVSSVVNTLSELVSAGEDVTGPRKDVQTPDDNTPIDVIVSLRQDSLGSRVSLFIQQPVYSQ